MQRIACITGATAGFGEACARHFVQEGWKVIITGRRQERLDALTNELGAENCLPLCLDVRNRDAVTQTLTSLPEAFAAVDVLVNNAGLALGLDSAQAANLDDWDIMVDTNIKGLTYCTRALLPGMIERKRGHVVNIGSCAGTYPYPGSNVYGATKSFVKQFSLNLRADLHGTGVRVSNIEPGMAKSEFSIVRFKGDAEKADNVYAGMEPLLPQDIAEIVHWVVSCPQHVNINRLEVMPTCQSFNAFLFSRCTTNN